MFLVQPATQIRFPGPFPSLVGPGGTPQLSWLSPEIPIFVGGTGTWKKLVGKSCIWASISRADSPWGPCLAASVWPISWMKSWTSPASSQPSWDLHTHTHTHTHTCAHAHTHTPLPLRVPDSPTFLYLWCGDLRLSREHMSAPVASWRCEEDRTLWSLSFGTPNPKGRSAETAPEAWVGIPALLCFSQ